MSAILVTIEALFGRLRVYLIAAGAALAAIGVALWRARASGKAAAEAEQAAARQELREKYDAIDREPVDVADAYDRLGRMRDEGRR